MNLKGGMETVLGALVLGVLVLVLVLMLAGFAFSYTWFLEQRALVGLMVFGLTLAGVVALYKIVDWRRCLEAWRNDRARGRLRESIGLPPRRGRFVGWLLTIGFIALILGVVLRNLRESIMLAGFILCLLGAMYVIGLLDPSIDGKR